MYGYGRRNRGFGWRDIGSFDFFTSEKTYYPTTYVDEDNESYTITLEIPGVENPEVEVKDSVLTISGVKKVKTTAGELEKKFSSSFVIPSDTKDDKITSSYKNGELVVVLPKKKPKIKKIKVLTE